MTKLLLNKKCIYCGTLYEKRTTCSKDYFLNYSKFCSIKCFHCFAKGKPNFKLRGIKRSEETKIKISKQTKKAMGNPLIKEKCRKARLGKKLSDETKRRMSKSHKGKKPYEMTDKIREKMSESFKGRIPWNKGIKMWEGKKHPCGMKGKKLSLEARK